MKLFKKLSLAVVLFFSLLISASAQTLKDVLNNSETPLFYLGIDFSKAKLLDVGNPTDIHDRLYASINQLVANEPKKFDLAGAFKKTVIEHDFASVNKSNEKINPNDILSTNSADYSRFKETDIAGIVKSLDLTGKTGVGLLFVMESMKKEDKKGLASIWITLIDMKTKKVLLTERVEEKAQGIGFRNYWASSIKNAIDDIDDSKYKEWKKKFGS